LILPQGADQFFNAEALSRIAAARAILNDDQAPGAIRVAVDALLADGRERQLTRRIQAEIAAMPSPAEVVDEICAISNLT
jgi:UDP:flavonoid glycosyltransferase YjiC (YdhE family)